MKIRFFDIEHAFNQQRYKEANFLINQCNFDDYSISKRARLLCWQAVCSQEAKDFDLAEEQYKKCIDFCEKNNVKDYYIPYYELSMLYLIRSTSGNGIKDNDLDNALLYCEEALKMCLEVRSIDSFGFHAGFSKDYLQIAILLATINQERGNYSLSIEILLLCKAVCREQRLMLFLGQVYHELGTSYTLSGNARNGLYYYHKSLAIKRKIGNINGLTITTETLIKFLDVLNIPIDEELEIVRIVAKERL